MSSSKENIFFELSKCIDNYQKFIETLSENVDDDFVRLGNLISCDKLSEFDKEIKFEHALHDLTDKCYRITNKKSQYYVHRYNPDFVIDLVKDLENKDEILEAFDLTPRDNCCNCVSFVCYSTGKINYLFDYLYSMKKSLDNITRCLNGFIARFYLDPSIFEVISENYKNTDPNIKMFSIHCYKLLKYILLSPIAETYIYFCKMIIEGLPISKVRTLRFLPMFEIDVNISVIREADGFVSYLDCHNINLFQSTNKILMFYDYLNKGIDIYYNYKFINSPNYYSPWLNNYSLLKYLYMKSPENEVKFKQYLDDNYNEHFSITEDIFKNFYPEPRATQYMNCIKLFNILAGTIAVKVKFSNEYLIKKINLINEIIRFSNIKYSTELSYNVDFMDRVLLGYDEVLLNELFDPLITLNKKTLSLNKIKDESEEEITKKINDKIGNITNMLIFINSGFNVFDMYKFEEEPAIIEYKKVQSIIGTKINMDGIKSNYSLNEICKPSYIELKINLDLVKNIEPGYILGWISKQNNRFCFFLDYIVDIAYTNKYLKDEYSRFFYNIGMNLLNKKFFNIPKYLNSSNIKSFLDTYELLNEFYNKIYPSSNPEPIINYKLKYLKYKEKYLKLKNNK